MRRRAFITLLGGAAAWPLAAGAQQPRIPLIGFLGTATRSAWGQWVTATDQRLRELGWIEGRNLVVEYRWAEGRSERYSEIAEEFVGLKVDVILTSGGAEAKSQRPSRIRSSGTTARTRTSPGRTSVAEQRQLEARDREFAEAHTQLDEALEQQTATSKVLQVISSSPGELGPVFEAMLANATSICEARFGVLYRYEDHAFQPAAMLNAPPASAARLDL